MAADFPAAFAALKTVLAGFAPKMAVKTDTPAEYTLVSKVPSPFPQHKGHPLEFASVKIGKAYVSFHLMPLYEAGKSISPELSSRKQGKTCLNFKAAPSPELLAELKTLTKSGFEAWRAKNWV